MIKTNLLTYNRSEKFAPSYSKYFSKQIHTVYARMSNAIPLKQLYDLTCTDMKIINQLSISRFFVIVFLFAFLTFPNSVYSQTPGQIFTAATPSPNPMDPNGDGWITSSGGVFTGGNELPEFEIPFNEVPQLTAEPSADLQTGATCAASEIVSDPVTGSAGGYYYILDPDAIPDNGDEQMVFRMRIARQANGAFGYSFLFDTDLKFGPSDPNSIPGNPGFEMEVIYGSGNNNDVLVENVDGTTSGTNIGTYDPASNSQRSDALNNNSSCATDPIFIDWYVPLSDIGITTTQNFRIAVATASSPSSALGGSASDILGVDGDVIADDDDQFAAAIYSSSDNDGDGVTDINDLDDDNDGLLDTEESSGVDPNADSDSDGVPDFLDPDYPGFIDSNSDGVNDNFDTDLDGLADHIDIDADGDGCNDVLEAGFTESSTISGELAGTGYGSNGLVTGGTDGYTGTNSDVTDSGAFPACSGSSDTDGDGVADASDPAPNDPCDPVQPGGYTGYDASNPTWAAADCDGDGLTNGDEDTNGSDPYAAADDSDGDGLEDYLDLDDDNDGIPDTYEQAIFDCESGVTPLFGAAQGPNNYLGSDINNPVVGDSFLYSGVYPGVDAIITIVSSTDTAIVNLDVTTTGFDENFQPQINHLDNNSFTEFRIDFVVAGSTTPAPPTTYILTTIDNDVNEFVTYSDSFTSDLYVDSPTDQLDYSGSAISAGFSKGYVSNGNVVGGIGVNSPQFQVAGVYTENTSMSIRFGSSTGDTSNHSLTLVPCVPRDYWVTPPELYVDTDSDGDGIVNRLDLDSDNDGIPDVLEAGFSDTNNDGLVETVSYGTNGLADEVETSADSGVLAVLPINTDAASDNNPFVTLYNFVDVDSDNDGISDTTEAFSNNATYNDSDNDGHIDGFVDVDDNGWHDPIDAEITFPVVLNSDADAIANYLDLDSDGDGLPDTFEGNFQVSDGDNDGIVGTGIPDDSDGDGLADSNDPDFPGNILGGFGFNQDRDGDGVKNYLDIDIDNDGIIDNIEGQSTSNHVGPTGSDTDGDGIDDAYDVNNGGVGIGYTNTDGGSAPDYADTNSDGIDGVGDAFDLLENATDNLIDGPLDGDNNGIVDPVSFVDFDGDGLHDDFEYSDPSVDASNNTTNALNATNSNQLPTAHPDTDPVGGDRDWRELSAQDKDQDGIPDVTDLDDDNDGILDVDEDENLDGDNDPRTNPS
ncbi:MAG: hypothetical protein HKO00_05060, partial [Flavobacteriaceae bacterium]|nr:hypothetical protein [Flavobacteriaceae bacterium]